MRRQLWSNLWNIVKHDADMLVTNMSKPPKLPTNAHRILPGLYLGAVTAVTDLRWRQRSGITHILSVMTLNEFQKHLQKYQLSSPYYRYVCCDNSDEEEENNNNYSYLLDCEHKLMDILDSPEANIYDMFGPCCVWISNQLKFGNTILIHCQQGRSRSVTIVAAYFLINYVGFTVEQVLDHLKMVRPQCNPNHGFVSQLQRWLRRNVKKPLYKILQRLMRFVKNPIYIIFKYLYVIN